ncbi:hypothetical protein JW766_00310 [Candidatus Dojkabacteria bacterium]|nr:hypothetical protein [Candidatus Dojkabacteria bacterium]
MTEEETLCPIRAKLLNDRVTCFWIKHAPIELPTLGNGTEPHTIPIHTYAKCNPKDTDQGIVTVRYQGLLSPVEFDTQVDALVEGIRANDLTLY